MKQKAFLLAILFFLSIGNLIAQNTNCDDIIKKVQLNFGERYFNGAYKLVSIHQTLINGQAGNELETELYRSKQILYLTSELMDVVANEKTAITVLHDSKNIFIADNNSNKINEKYNQIFSSLKDTVNKYVSGYYCFPEENKIETYFALDALHLTKGLQKQVIIYDASLQVVEIRNTYLKSDFSQEERIKIIDYQRNPEKIENKILSVLSGTNDQLNSKYANYIIKDFRSQNN